MDPSRLLVLNHNQEYSLTIDSGELTETLCLFFRPEFVQDAVRVASREPVALLDEPVAAGVPVFAERLHSSDSAVGRGLRRLHAEMEAAPEPLWLEARLFEIAGELAKLAFGERKKAVALDAVKASTREELFRRVARARSFLDAHFDDDAGLEAAARAGCLSAHHFHRVFRQAFGITPHRYVVERRLARAKYLLRRGGMPVVEVCAAVGFSSVGSFSSLFRRRFGVTPGKLAGFDKHCGDAGRND